MNKNNRKSRDFHKNKKHKNERTGGETIKIY